MKKKTILEKWKSKSIAMLMAGIMVFAMAPLGTGVAFADEENAEPAEEPAIEAVEDIDVEVEAPEAAVEEDIVEAPEAVTDEVQAAAAEEPQDVVEAKAATRTIKASEITDDMLKFRNNKGYLVSEQNTILYIDKDITLHSVQANDRVWDSVNRVWTGSYYDLTIRGDGQHTLTILADLNGEDALEANNITMESGNVEATLTDPVNAVDAKEYFYMKGGNLKVNVHATGWSNFTAYNLIVSGGNLTVLDTDAERETNGAILCETFAMTGGKVRGESIKGAGVRIYENATVAGGEITTVGRTAGIDCYEAFKMTGGSITGTATRDNSDFWRAFNFGRTVPVFGENVKITYPKNATIGTHYYDGADHYVVVDANGDKVRTATVEYVQPAAPAPVAKKANTLTLKAKKTTKIKAKKMKKKAKSFNISKFVTVGGARGAVTYAKASGNKKITIASNGKVTFQKKIRKGTYKIKVNVTAAGNANFNKATKAVTFTIKVK